MKNIPLRSSPGRIAARWLSTLVALGLLLNACSLPSLPIGRQATSTPAAVQTSRPAEPKPVARALPPALVETDPLPGGEVAPGGALVLSFNQAMDQASVEAAVQVQPALGGRFDWRDEATLLFFPDTPLNSETGVQVTVDTTARAANGQTLADPVSLHFQGTGNLELTQRLPEPDSGQIDPTSAVVAAFNRPVVALGADAADTPAAFTLDPPAEGRSEWLNTSTYIFYPQPGLAGGTEYRVQINPDLRGVDGAALAAPELQWSFTTSVPELLTVEPTLETPVPLDAAFLLRFNQPMQRETVEAAFSLQDATFTRLPGAFEWNERSTEVGFTPEALLARGSDYALNLSTEARGQGGAPIAQPYSGLMRSVSPLAVLSTEPPDTGRLELFGGYASFSVQFNGPLDEVNLTEQISLTPQVGELFVYYDPQSSRLHVSALLNPNTSYSVTLSSQISDPWGGSLGAPYTFSFTTTPSQPALRLASDQLGLEAVFLTPSDTSLPAQAVNLTSLDLTSGPLTWEEFTRLAGPDGYNLRSSFQPANPQSWTQPVAPAPDLSQQIEINVTPQGLPLSPGFYFLRVFAPEMLSDNQAGIFPITLVVSRTAVTLKVAHTEALVWAADVEDGSPVVGQPVTLYDSNWQVLIEGTTDENGLFRGPIPVRADPYMPVFALVGEPGAESFGFTSSNWNAGVQGWDFGLTANFQPEDVKVQMYTDRPIYRPGQTIYFRGIVRQAENGRYTQPDLFHMLVELYGVSGDISQPPLLETLDLPLSDFGTVHGQFTLPADAQPGYYRLAVPDFPQHDLYLQVAEYRKPEINLTVSFPSADLQTGEAAEAAVEARYFFDAPAGGLPVRWSLYRAADYFSIPGAVAGTFTEDWLLRPLGELPSGVLGLLVDQGETLTGPNGQVGLPLDLGEPVSESGRPWRYTLEVTAADESGLPVSARASLRVHPAAFYAGIDPDRWSGQAGTPMGFDIVTVTISGQPVEVQNLQARFRKVTWRRETNSIGMPSFTPEYTLSGSVNFSTDPTGQARLEFTPSEPGTYELEVGGGGARTQALLWVAGQGTVQWPDLSNQQIRLAADQVSYNPGDTARVFIPNPFGALVPALVTVERAGILRAEVIGLDGSGVNYELPITGAEAPNIYISATLLGTANGRPDFRQGYLEIEVAPVEQTLTVELVGTPVRAQPGGEVTFSVRVTGADGEPVRGEFSLAVADLAALALADPNTPGLVDAFYGPQPLGVQTGQSMAAYAGRDLFFPEGRGGGGDGSPDAPGVVREDFPDTAYWNAEIVTDADGLAQVTVPLPDSLTTWQADLRGLTADTRVGEASAQVVTSKDLLVRPVTPRFLVVGDHLELAAVVQNNTSGALDVSVALRAAGFTLDEPNQTAQTVSLAAGGRARVGWWGTVQTGTAEIDAVFSAQAGSLQDAARPSGGPLPVLAYSSPQTFGTAGVLPEGGERLEVVSFPRSFQPTGGALSVTLEPSLAAVLSGTLEALEGEPFDHTEGLLSRLLPNVEVMDTLRRMNANDPDLLVRAQNQARSDLARLLGLQNEDGGWAWSEGGQSQPFLSAYVLFGLTRASQAGLVVDVSVIQRAQAYLRASQIDPGMASQDWQLDAAAFSAFAMTESGAGDLPALDALYPARARLAPWAQAFLALSIERLNPGDERARTLISDLESAAVRSATGAHWEVPGDRRPTWATPVQTTAVVVLALAQRDPAAPLLADALRYLISNRQATRMWRSSYETAWTILALARALEGTGDLGQANYDFTAELNDNPLASGSADAAAGVPASVSVQASFDQLVRDAPNALVIGREDGPGRLYYTAHLRADRPVEDAPAYSAGVVVEREYYLSEQDCVEAACEPLGAATLAGTPQYITARVTVTLPHDAYALIVEDFIPAGAEIFNPGLKTSQQGLPGAEPQARPYSPDDPYQDGWGWWYFGSAQVFDQRIRWTAEYVPAGTYVLTYTLIPFQAGEYRVLPARAWEYYFPEVWGSSPGKVFRINP